MQGSPGEAHKESDCRCNFTKKQKEHQRVKDKEESADKRMANVQGAVQRHAEPGSESSGHSSDHLLCRGQGKEMMLCMEFQLVLVVL